MERKRLGIYLHGGLGDQLRKYFAGVYLAQLTKRELFFDTSLQHEWHLGDTSSLSSLFGSLPIDNEICAPRNRVRTFLKRRFPSSYSKGKIDGLFSYFEDFDNLTYQNEMKADEVISKLERWKKRKTISINGYFPNFTFFRNIASHADLKFKIQPLHFPRRDCLVHFRTGDDFAQDVIEAPDFSYYKNAINLVKNYVPEIRFVGVADNIPKAKRLYSGLTIDWLEDSDKWDSYKLFSILSTAQYYVSSQSGISIWALALSPKRTLSILPRVSKTSELGEMLDTGDFSKSIFIDSTLL